MISTIQKRCVMSAINIGGKGGVVVVKLYTPDVIHLRDRVRLGNEKLNQAWELILEIEHSPEERSEKVEQWHQANERLSNLCTDLALRGYVDCLYLNEKGEKVKRCLAGLGCRVCPSSTHYWEREFDELPSASGRRSGGGTDQMGFLKTLGGKEE